MHEQVARAIVVLIEFLLLLPPPLRGTSLREGKTNLRRYGFYSLARGGLRTRNMLQLRAGPNSYLRFQGLQPLFNGFERRMALPTLREGRARLALIAALHGALALQVHSTSNTRSGI